MADPKYAELPGIDYENKDVYESGDLPEEDQFYEGDQSENVEIVGVDMKDLFGGFSDKYVHRKNFGLNGDDEMILEKFGRLKLELSDLMEQVTIKKGKKAEDACDLLQQVENLQAQVKMVDENQYFGNMVDGNISNVLEGLNAPLESGKSSGAKTLQKLQHDTDQKQSTRIVELEHRLARLEKILGNKSNQVSILAPQGTTLRESVYNLGSKLAMLDNDNLPQVDSRLQSILTKVNEINKVHKGSGGQVSEVNQKVTEMYEMMKKWEKVRESLPYLIERLRSLDTLHSKATNFTAILDHLESTQAQISGRIDSSNSAQKKLGETLKQNVSTIQANIKALNKRMKNLNN